MKIRNFLLNLTVALSALLFGLMWVGVYQYFTEKTLGEEVQSVVVKKVEQPAFDITNPESVLPIDFEEDKLSDPKEDEDNPTYFDPRGFYFNDNLPKDFEEFAYIEIYGRDYEISATKENSLIFDKLKGNLIADDWRKDEEDRLKTFQFDNLKIGNENLYFTAKTQSNVTYKFQGEFLTKGNFYTLDEDAKVLKGKLVKLKNNLVLDEIEVEFKWTNSIGCCLR